VVPLLAGIVLRIVSARHKHIRLLAKAWRNSFGTYFFYNLLFLAYGELACLAISVRYMMTDTESLLGVAVGGSFAIVLGGYLIALQKFELWMGSFKNRFRKFSISLHVYTFSTIERFITPFLIVFFAPSFIAPAGVSAVLILEALFFAIKKPYLLWDWKRALFLKMCAISICLIHLGDSLTAEGSTWTLYTPLAIPLILLVVLIVNIATSINFIKEYLSDIKSKLNIAMPTGECNRMIMRQFEQKMPTAETSPYPGISTAIIDIELKRAAWDW
jgi:hypothetical protein